MEETLKKITEFAREAHGDQRRKFAPEPYIVHPIRVMELCRQHTNDIAVLAAALLHDVLEDTSVTADQMEDFLVTVLNEKQAKQTGQLVIELTDVYIKKNFPEWNRRKRRAKETERLSKASGHAQTVKYADIIDNSRDIVNAESDFARKYLEECLAIVKAMKQGNKDLYEKALATVEECLEKVKIRYG